MYAKVKNGKVVAYPVNVRAAFPNVSLPADLTIDGNLPEGYVFVHPSPLPTATGSTQIEEGTPEIVSGKWCRSWKVKPLSKELASQRSIELKTRLTNQTMARLDNFASTKHYSSILDATSYAYDSNSDFAKDAARCIVLRSKTFGKLYEILKEVESGDRELPEDISEIASELPSLTWDE